MANCGATYGAFAAASALPAICLVQIAGEFHLNDAQSGLIFATGAAVSFVTLPVFGLLAERIGKRGLLAGGLTLLLVGLAVFRAAPHYSILLAASATLGLASSIIEALVSPLVTDLCPRRTAPVMNLVHACYQVGLVVVAIGAGTYLAVGGRWTATFWPLMVMTALLAACFALTRFPAAVVPEAPHGVLSLLRQPAFWLCAVGMAVAGGVEVGVTNWVSSYLQREFDLTTAGAALADRFGLVDSAPLLGGMGLVLFAAPMVVGRWFYGSIAERFGCVRTLLASSVISLGALTGLGFSATATAAVAWLAILGLAISGMWPTLLSYAGTVIPAGLPTLYSLLAMAGLLGVAGCSWGIGQLADVVGLQGGLTALAAPVLLGMAAFAALPAATSAGKKR